MHDQMPSERSDALSDIGGHMTARLNDDSPFDAEDGLQRRER
jgi:hypothetical protein